MANQQQNTITLGNWNQGGVSDGLFSGQKYSQAAIVGVDLHRTPSVAQAAQKMTKESGATVTEFCKFSLSASDGNTYWCSSTSGKVWRRTSLGVWSKIATIDPGGTGGSAGIVGIAEYGAYVYIATEKKLHRIAVANIATWTAAQINWQEFTNGSAISHQMFEVSGVLYIADGNLVAQVDANGTEANPDSTNDDPFFTPDALDLPTEYKITTLGRLGTDLLIGAGIADNVAIARVFRWNTYSVSWTDDVVVSEVGVNAIMMLNESVLISCGTKGNLYQYTGSLQPFKKIPGNYSPTATSIIYPQAWVNRDVGLLIGNSNLAGNPSKHATWQLGRYSNVYPLVLSTDFPISTGNMQNVQIGAILMIGDDVLISWKDTTTGNVFGVDKIDYTSRFSNAYIETMVMAFSREEIKNFLFFAVDLASIPADGCGLLIKYKKQNDTDWSDAGEMNELYDAERIAYVIEQGVQAASLQLRIEFVTNENDSPELYDVVIMQE